ncbi:MAG: DNA repair protein RecN, partial [Ilumatobacter coccineus]
IQTHLRDLAMSQAMVSIEVGGDDPADEVTFLLSANPGSPPRPLTKVASGGELARVMLAIRLNMIDDDGATLVFDEVDAGIGGTAAISVGSALAHLGERHQVIVVTHLAQVAAQADHQIRIVKRSDGQSTLTKVVPVSGEDRVVELARMLAGTVTDRALDHARDLLASSET